MINSNELIGVYSLVQNYYGQPPELVPIAVPWFDQYGNVGSTATRFAYVPGNYYFDFTTVSPTNFGLMQRAVTMAQMVAIWYALCVVNNPAGQAQAVIASGNGSVNW